MSVTCAELMPGIIHSFTDELSPEFYEDEALIDALLKYCTLFDAVIAANDGTFDRIEIDDNMKIHLCADMETIAVLHPGASDPLHYLISRSEEVNIQSVGEEVMELDLTFGGVWKMEVDIE